MATQQSDLQTLILSVVQQACELCSHAQKSLIPDNEQLSKEDNSPVTIALQVVIYSRDYAVQALVIYRLSQTYDYPFIAEEDSSDLKEPKNKAFVERILQILKSALPNMSPELLMNTLDKGKTAQAPKTGFYWTLDPIDGTQGFLRKDQYAVALALMKDHQPVYGVLGCPNLEFPAEPKQTERGCILFAEQGKGAFVRPLANPTLEPVKIGVSGLTNLTQAKFTESFVSRGFGQKLTANITGRLQTTAPPLRIDSQCKYAVLAAGLSDVYIRLSSVEYEEKVWDHAAGVIIVKEAGGFVCDFYGKPFDWSAGRTLKNNTGLIAANLHLKDTLLNVCKEELEKLIKSNI